MMNNENNKQNLDIVENQENLEQATLTLEEMTKEAEKEEKTQAELDLMRTKLGHKRVIRRLIEEEGFEVDELAEEKRIAHELAIENETVKEDLQRRIREYKESWQDPTQRKVQTKKIVTFIAAFFRTFILVGLCFVILMPIIEKISFALRAPQDIANKQVVWIPETWSVMNIRIAFTYLTLMKDASYEGIGLIYPISTFFNSIWLSFMTTVIQVIATAIAGYSFARLKFKGNNILFIAVIITLIVPSESLESARKLIFLQLPFFGIELLKSFSGHITTDADKEFIKKDLLLFAERSQNQLYAYLNILLFNSCKKKIFKDFEIKISAVYKHYWYLNLYCYYLTRPLKTSVKKYIFKTVATIFEQKKV